MSGDRPPVPPEGQPAGSPPSPTGASGPPRRPGGLGGAGRARGPRPAPAPPAIPERTPDPDKLIVGRVIAARGAQGEFRIAVLTNQPEGLTSLRTLYLGDDDTPYHVRHIQLRGDGAEAVVQVAELTTPDEAAAHRGQLVRIDRADAPPLPEGEYYHYQLIGLDVVDTDGRLLGRLARIIETGANDVYVVIGPEGEILLPAIESVVREVDLDSGRMVVQPPEYY